MEVLAVGGDNVTYFWTLFKVWDKDFVDYLYEMYPHNVRRHKNHYILMEYN